MEQERERPLRVLMIAPTSFFSDYGGHIRIMEEACTLQGVGIAVTIVTYYKGKDIHNLDIRRTPPLPWRADYEVGSSRHKIAFDLYLAVQSLVEALRVKPDIIHGHMHEGALIGGLLAKLLRVPLVFDFQGSLTGEMIDHHFIRAGGKVHRVLAFLEKVITKMPQAILTSSIRSGQILQEQFQVPAAKIYPLPDCADLGRFNPKHFSVGRNNRLKRRLGIPLDRPIVAYLGLLTDYQGIPQLLQAVAQLKKQGIKVHFLIMGYPNLAHYQTMARQLGIQAMVTFTGKVPFAQAPDYLALGDIAVTAKMSLTEGSGKILNYMAMAQPVVAFDTAVHREYLADWGIYVPVGDIVMFAEAIQSLLNDPEKAAVLGRKLRARAEKKYSWQQAGAKIYELYQTLLTNQ